jgi:hypothetical protein
MDVHRVCYHREMAELAGHCTDTLGRHTHAGTDTRESDLRRLADSLLSETKRPFGLRRSSCLTSRSSGRQRQGVESDPNGLAKGWPAGWLAELSRPLFVMCQLLIDARWRTRESALGAVGECGLLRAPCSHEHARKQAPDNQDKANKSRVTRPGVRAAIESRPIADRAAE